eukprot:TRINITY_DN65838_c3_g7_i2.p2 TRINITY_DN65838_c3_g7~~TRINITY_DN65838_c3_g7_i2.p2  ORF type:complete len:814 (-),score=436.37 TRINITY_DN65838_c3_g7_i2:1200-3368(-)
MAKATVGHSEESSTTGGCGPNNPHCGRGQYVKIPVDLVQPKIDACNPDEGGCLFPNETSESSESSAEPDPDKPCEFADSFCIGGCNQETRKCECRFVLSPQTVCKRPTGCRMEFCTAMAECLPSGHCQLLANDTWGGAMQKNWDPCFRIECMNGGNCSRNGSTAGTCQCAKGYGGDLCEKVLPKELEQSSEEAEELLKAAKQAKAARNESSGEESGEESGESAAAEASASGSEAAELASNKTLTRLQKMEELTSSEELTPAALAAKQAEKLERKMYGLEDSESTSESGGGPECQRDLFGNDKDPGHSDSDADGIDSHGQLKKDSKKKKSKKCKKNESLEDPEAEARRQNEAITGGMEKLPFDVPKTKLHHHKHKHHRHHHKHKSEASEATAAEIAERLAKLKNAKELKQQEARSAKEKQAEAKQKEADQERQEKYVKQCRADATIKRYTLSPAEDSSLCLVAVPSQAPKDEESSSEDGAGALDGAPLKLAKCSMHVNHHWVTGGDGSLRWAGNCAYCLEVADQAATLPSHGRLQLAECSGLRKYQSVDEPAIDNSTQLLRIKDTGGRCVTWAKGTARHPAAHSSVIYNKCTSSHEWRKLHLGVMKPRSEHFACIQKDFSYAEDDQHNHFWRFTADQCTTPLAKLRGFQCRVKSAKVTVPNNTVSQVRAYHSSDRWQTMWKKQIARHTGEFGVKFHIQKPLGMEKVDSYIRVDYACDNHHLFP